MTNRFCDTEIWSKDWFLELNTKQKLLVKFLFDNCDCAGFYKISWHLLKVFFNDVEITREDFEKIKQVKFLNDNLVFIEDFALYQCKVKSFNDLNPKNNAHKGVLKLLKKYDIFEAPNEGLVSPLEGAQEKEKEKEKEEGKNTFLQVVEKEKEKEKEKKSEKKLDPFVDNPIIAKFRTEHERIIGTKLYLTAQQRMKIMELNSEISDFTETITTAFLKVKNINFDIPNFKPNGGWLLKEDNYTNVLNGMYDKCDKKEESKDWTKDGPDWYVNAKARLAEKGIY